MNVRAKLQVDEVKLTSWSDEVKLSAVCGKTGEDNSFSQATPSASFTMVVSNTNVRGFFKPGMKFYVDFTQTDEVTQ